MVKFSIMDALKTKFEWKSNSKKGCLNALIFQP